MIESLKNIVETLEKAELAKEQPKEEEEYTIEYCREKDFITPGHPNYDENIHIATLIDGITINTLSVDTKIEEQSARTLLLLDQLRNSRLGL